MRVCYFGTYSTQEGYPRNSVLIKGLRDNGAEVLECHVELWKDSADRLRAVKAGCYNFSLLARIIYSHLLLIFKFLSIKHYDFLVVGYPGFSEVLLAKLLNIFRRKPLIYDAFISLYDTAVNDRRIVGPRTFKASLLWIIDKIACSLADIVMVDTQAHKEYFSKEFKIKPAKILTVYLGEREDIFNLCAQVARHQGFSVLYFGTYLPLHGVEYILKAAKLLTDISDINFIFVGRGPDYENIRNLSKQLEVNNIKFIDNWLDYGQLKDVIEQADVCLGVFGLTQKASRVIPCKVYDSLAMAKPVITGDSPAAREILTDKNTALLCEMGNAQAIKEGILLLKSDQKLREDLAADGYKLFKDNFSSKKIGEKLLLSLEGLLKTER